MAVLQQPTALLQFDDQLHFTPCLHLLFDITQLKTAETTCSEDIKNSAHCSSLKFIWHFATLNMDCISAKSSQCHAL